MFARCWLITASNAMAKKKNGADCGWILELQCFRVEIPVRR